MRKEGKIERKLFEEDCCSNLILLQLFSWENLLISSVFILSLRNGIWHLLHLVPSRETRASSGVLRSRWLSALQELVGRNGLPLLLSSKLKEQVLLFINFCVLSMCDWMMHCSLWCKDLDGLEMKSFLVCLIIELFWWEIKPYLCFSSFGVIQTILQNKWWNYK